MTTRSPGLCEFRRDIIISVTVLILAVSYARGILFPSEAKRVQAEIMGDLERWNNAKSLAPVTQSEPEGFVEVFGPRGIIIPSWVRSTVTTFHVRYTPPVPDLSLNYSIEALIEGTDMSRLTKRTHTAPLTGCFSLIARTLQGTPHRRTRLGGIARAG